MSPTLQRVHPMKPGFYGYVRINEQRARIPTY